jgi:hypothetical protein
MRVRRHILDEDPRRMARSAPQAHEVALSRNLSDLTDAELLALIDAPARLLPRPG